MMSDVLSNLPLNTDGGVMKGHAGLLLAIEIAIGVIICILEGLLFLVAVIIPWVEALIRLLRTTDVEKRMIPGIPSAIAYVETPDKGNLLIYDDHLSMMAPELDVPT